MSLRADKLLLIGASIKVFTIGIHTCEKGWRAWFETFLVTATLMSCGYLAFHVGILILIALVCLCIAAGVATCFNPLYTTQNNLAINIAIEGLQEYVQAKNEKLNILTGYELVEELNIHFRAINELSQKFPNLAQDYPAINEVLESMMRAAREGYTKVNIEEQERRQQQARHRQQQQNSVEILRQQQDQYIRRK